MIEHERRVLFNHLSHFLGFKGIEIYCLVECVSASEMTMKNIIMIPNFKSNDGYIYIEINQESPNSLRNL